MIARLVERLPARVSAALQDDREALIGLLIAADVAWQVRADRPDTVAEVALAAHQFADAVADCCSGDVPPSDRRCDTGLALAARVDALAIEVVHRRAQEGIDDDTALPQRPRPPAREVRHLARAHVAALRDAAIGARVVSDLDVDAAEAALSGLPARSGVPPSTPPGAPDAP